MQTIAIKINQPAIDLEKMNNPSLSQDRFTKVKIDGAYINNHTFLLDNQMLEHKAGFRVLTPMQTPNLKPWILVDRGWVPLVLDRQNLPHIKASHEIKDIVGMINTIPGGIVLSADKVDPQATWPLIIQRLDYKFISQQLNHEVFDFVVQLTPTDPDAYPFPPLDVGVSVAKHFAYAVQWFIFAAILLVYFCIISVKRTSNV